MNTAMLDAVLFPGNERLKGRAAIDAKIRAIDARIAALNQVTALTLALTPTSSESRLDALAQQLLDECGHDLGKAKAALDAVDHSTATKLRVAR